jgi:hypothetical protein
MDKTIKEEEILSSDNTIGREDKTLFTATGSLWDNQRKSKTNDLNSCFSLLSQTGKMQCNFRL